MDLFHKRFCDGLSLSTDTTTDDEDAFADKSIIENNQDPDNPDDTPMLPPQIPIKRSTNKQAHAILNHNNLNVQFSRSSVGGSKYLMTVHPTSPDVCELMFESRFESGNLAKAIKITPVYYELYLRSDMYTDRHSQWFYFRVMNTRKGIPYR